MASGRGRVAPLTLPLVAVLAACAATRVPPLGSPEAVLATDERRLWASSRELERKLAATGLAIDDPALEAYLAAVATALLRPEERAALPELRVRVLRHPEANAIALPHGSVWIHTGLLARVENEAQLATVVGHELAHVVRRHGLREERAAKNTEAWAGVGKALLLTAGAALGQGGVELASVLGEQAGTAWARASVGGYSRDLEREADEGGFATMRAAGYDVREAPAVFTLLERDAEGDDAGWAFFASHPRLAERRESYRALVAASGAAPGRADSPGFRRAVAPVLLDNALLDLDRGRPDLARVAIDRYVGWRPDDASGYLVLGTFHRRTGRDATHAADAIAAFERAAALGPHDGTPWRELGYVLREEGRDAEARAAFRRYLRLEPDAVDAPLVRTLVEAP